MNPRQSAFRSDLWETHSGTRHPSHRNPKINLFGLAEPGDMSCSVSLINEGRGRVDHSGLAIA